MGEQPLTGREKNKLIDKNIINKTKDKTPRQNNFYQNLIS